MEYEELIKSKAAKVEPSGFNIEIEQMNPLMKEFQKWSTQKALLGGRFALFLDCGLGKTFCGMEWANWVTEHTGKPVLVATHLAVVPQWAITEANKFGYELKYFEKMSDFEYTDECTTNGTTAKPIIYVTNYEKCEKFPTHRLGGIVLDESSILKNFQGKLRNFFIDEYQNVAYKLCMSATPSPNDPMELANQAEFLGIMKREEVLAMFFVNDAANTGSWRLKRHAIEDFYQWVASWAVMASKPSDIGFPDKGYILPPLNYHNIEVTSPKKDNGLLFNETAVSATEFNSELRVTIHQRLEEATKLVNNSDEPWIIWGKLNPECEALEKAIPGSVNVQGSDKNKGEKLTGFAKGEFRILITKQKIAAYGLNYQHCPNQLFVSPDFSFEQLYQAIRRSWRFGAKNAVNIHIVTTDTMQNVMQSLQEKAVQFDVMRSEMQKAMNTAMQKNNIFDRSSGMVKKGKMWEFVNGDCVTEAKMLKDNSVGLSIFSPPFADLYTFSDDPRDMANSSNWEQFMDHFRFLVKEMRRVMMPGRIVAVHCMDLPIQKGKEGYIGLRDFSGLLLDAFQSEDFIYHARTTIWKNPVTEMQRTKALGLLHKTIKKDSSMSRVGIPDYVMFFRAPGDNSEPITHQDNDSNRDDFLSVDTWQKFASPVWMDIDYGNTLQYTTARDGKDEKHICPLQLDTIERCLRLYSNPGDIVASFFGGIASEGYKAVSHGRRFWGVELKPSYWRVGVRNLKEAENTRLSWKLF